MRNLLTHIGQLFIRLRALEEGHRRPIRIGLAAGLFLFLLVYQIFLKAPADFPVGQMVHIPKGASLGEITNILEEKNVIKSPNTFQFFVLLAGGHRALQAGDYLFMSRVASPRVAFRLRAGEFNLTPVKITVPEGTTLKEISTIAGKKISTFDSKRFLELTKGKEGYLFPDTYYFFPNASTETVALEMENNFRNKLGALYDDIKKSEKSVRDTIIMASILEKEAHESEDRKIIAGILWKRIEMGMPLQVDAVFAYVNGKSTYELTTKDLKTDGPYNTYTRKGLPIGPIGNPGLDAIVAALSPKQSPFLYYLSDREGNVYYSATYDAHKKKKVLYID